MRAAIYSVDVVGKRMDDFVIGIVVLNRYVYRKRIVFLAESDRLTVQDRFTSVQMFDKFGDAAFVEKLVSFISPLPHFCSLIGDSDAYAGIQKRFFTQSLRKG